MWIRNTDSEKKQKLDEILSNANKDLKLWTYDRKNLFKQFWNISDLSYFGRYEECLRFNEDPEEFFVLEGKSPKVYVPKELSYFGKVKNGLNENDVTYVLRDKELNQFYYNPHRYYEEPFKDKAFYLQKVLARSIDEHSLFFTKEEAVEECKKLNKNRLGEDFWKNLGKTLNSMKSRLKEFIDNGYALEEKQDDDDEER